MTNLPASKSAIASGTVARPIADECYRRRFRAT
jgi:hypothetical protein